MEKAIPFLFEEDETSNEQRPEYNQKTDNVFGYCGLKGENHQCQEYYVIKVSCFVLFLYVCA